MTHEELEARLGYRFSNPGLLVEAITHRSFGVPHNERLEFLGDSVLNCHVARIVYQRFAHLPEGDLSRIRANLVNQASLAAIANSLELGKVLRLGEGEVKSGGALRASLLADALEAVLGAQFLDAGFDRTGTTIDRLVEPLLVSRGDLAPEKDAKTQLQEWLQARREPLPDYQVVRIEGAQHQQTFIVECRIAARGIACQGGGTSRRAAEQQAANLALARLEGRGSGAWA